jgi:mono/diheme cytochrome c family protein/glucose/arabinose dehydrogenase
MRGSLRVFGWWAVLSILAATPARAQEGAEDEPFLPGLVANYQDARGHTATRLDPQLAFHWGDLPPDPRLDESEFRATWQGHLLVATSGDYRFFVFGSGEIELKIAGRIAVARQTLRKGWQASAPLRLTPDNHPLALSFRRTDKDAHLMVLWSGPDFGLEPIPPRALFHPREKPAGSDFERGRLLARVLRCGRCHGDEQPPPAPALDRLSGNLARGWLVHWLAEGEQAPPRASEVLSPRRMPALGLSGKQAEAVANWLLTPHEREHSAPAPPRKEPARKKVPKPDAHIGERLFVTLGCLACHTWRDLGASGWLGGGDLTHIANKRPPGFFAAWLADPDRLNRDHRMPVFTLADDERTSLALFLATQKAEKSNPDFRTLKLATRRAEGRELVAQFRCGACHRLPESVPAAPMPAQRLNERSNWDHACSGAPDDAKHRPGYRLSKSDAHAVRLYYSGSRTEPRNGRLLLAEQNCLACHAREGTREAIPLMPPLLADKLTAVVKRYPDLAPLVPALTPPALNSVGDKLTDSALVEAIVRRGVPHRPYLQVRMPRFPLAEKDVQTLVQELIATDRIPPRPLTLPSPPGGGEGLGEGVDRVRQDRYALAGGRLISSDGFGCTSCHQVGSVRPSNAPLNARGPDLSQLDRRIRRPWFDRWVRNPARIVPRMEMPSVQIPVSGVLDGKLDDQLAAVWHVLNVPGFEPPLPNPIRTLRHTGNNPGAEALVLTDVIQNEGKTRIKPFLVGLANRHNVLLDLEAGGLTAWTVGDMARQRTKGKAWLWELAGTAILDTRITSSDLSLVVDGRELSAQPLGQFVTEADAWQNENAALVVHYRLKFSLPTTAMLQVRRKLAPLTVTEGRSASGFTQELMIASVPAGTRIRLHVLPAEAAARATRSADGRSLRLSDRFASRIFLVEPADARFTEDGSSVLAAPDAKGTARVVLHYRSEIPIDRFPEVSQPPVIARKGEPVEVAPGFTGERLPLSAEIMPTGLTWRPDGRLIFCSLKGQVFEAVDTDGDGSEDRLRVLADGLPAPYGVHAGPCYIDVSAKYAVLRLGEESKSNRRIETVASGWGYSQDYHDWAIGLPQNERGEYFLGIPCQQDKRSPAAARFHGHVLRLLPRTPTTDDPRRFALAPISSGHRFPMGLALDRAGELFVTDNQGNYKPFNELNYVRPGAYFGFVNSLDRGKPAPATTPPAIDIPHPWTRSVNGICFLYTAKELRAKLGRDAFGPLEGHLIGCEYDTRRLIRMTLQRVGDTFQGAAYPLSIPPQDPQRGFLGPLVCAVSPRGELYVGSIRDSGWGAGNNVGEIVRVQIHPDKLPCGIAEVRATHDGFVLDFFRPIDRNLAGRAESYAIQSYRREATPAYGGPDRDRRTEKVTDVAIAADAGRVTLKLAEMRPGFVYELRLKNLAPGGGDFHPAEAHYTLRIVPK